MVRSPNGIPGGGLTRLAGTSVLALADLVCPERCAACPNVVLATILFCADCRRQINVLATSTERTSDGVVRSARAWAAYGDGAGSSPIARALATFKYGRAQRLGRRLAAAMRTCAPPKAHIVLPIPLHPRRLRARGFNQSAVLARHLGPALGAPVAVRLLRRIRDTPSQTALSIVGRAENVAGAFVVDDPGQVVEREVLLIDDVWTSGATARAAATALRSAGAAAVDVLTFARVL